VVLRGRTVWVSSKRHLIEAKRAVQPPRKVDLRDIEDLEELLKP
jgi:glutamate synthase domain-containing protein 2